MKALRVQRGTIPLWKKRSQTNRVCRSFDPNHAATSQSASRFATAISAMQIITFV
jgi:hypothetical protein